jgi:MFS family permease
VTGPLSDRWGRKGLIAAGMWAQAAGLFITAWTGQFEYWLVGSLLLGIGTAMVYPSLIAAVSDASHPTWRARSLSVYRFWRDLGYAIGALSAGIIADRLGLAWAIGAVAALTFLSGIVVAVLMREHLTEGKPSVVAIRTAPSVEESDLLALTASLERNSEHPLAAAIVRAASERGLALHAVEAFDSPIGKGVTGSVASRKLVIGNRRIMTEAGIDTAMLDQAADELRREGATAIFVAIDGTVAGVIAIADPIKATTPAAVSALKEAGIRVVMLTRHRTRSTPLGGHDVQYPSKPLLCLYIQCRGRTSCGRRALPGATEPTKTGSVQQEAVQAPFYVKCH